MRLDTLNVIGVAMLLLFAGCGTQPTGSMETTQLDTTTSSSPTISPMSTPERPQELTAENVVQFASELAEARTHNRLLRDDAVSISVNCDSSLRATSASGYYLETVCGGYADYDDLHVDLGVTPTAYFVGDEVRRIDDSRTEIRSADSAFSSSNSSKNFVPPYQSAEVRVYNFDSSRREVSITVQYTDGSRNESVISGEYSVYRTKGLILDRITRKKGEYEVVIRLDDAKVGRYSWNVTNPSETPVFSVYISREGDVLVSS